MPAAPKFDAMVDALVQEMFKVTRFDARRMSPKARSVVAAAAIEFLIVTVAALPARHRALAVRSGWRRWRRPWRRIENSRSAPGRSRFLGCGRDQG